MSPFLKAVLVGLTVLAGSLFIMWLTTRILGRPFFPRLPRATPTTVTTPTPTLLFPLRR